MKSMQLNNTSTLAMQNGVSQVSEHWVENAKQEQLRREEESARKTELGGFRPEGADKISKGENFSKIGI